MRKLSALVLALPLLLTPAAGYAAGLGENSLEQGKTATAGNAAHTLKDVAVATSQSTNSIKKSTNTNDGYVVISNESTDETTEQPTGSFELKSIKKSTKSGTYQIDYNKPYDPVASQGKLIRKSTSSTIPVYHVGDTKLFWVTNLTTDQYYQISAKLAYSGTKALVWVNNNQITDDDAVKLGTEFDTKIHPEVVNNFGSESDVDHDGKVNILCYDIQDGFSGSGGYVAGYFGAGDLYNTTYSNKSEIFYIDTYPTMGTGSAKDVTQAYSTLAHEFQHMVNFNQNVLVEGGQPMDTWIDEGLSMASEQIYTGEGLADRRDYYDESEAIQDGQSLLYWDDTGDTLANYSLSYLFLQYLKIQAGQGDSIFKEIIDDPNNNYKAVEDVAKRYIDRNITFGKLMTDFRLALVLKNPTGLYGFKGDPFFDSIQPPIFTGSTVSLRGGGAVVTTFNSANGFSVPASKGANISYTFLERDASGNLTLMPATASLQGSLKGWVLSNGSWYYYDSMTGKAVTGWRKVSGKWYFFNGNGVMKTGWLQTGGKWYYLDASGAMKTGWLQTGGKWYYLDASGAMKTGWMQISRKWYYLNAAGAMKTGWVQIGSKWYYLNKDGSMARNTIISGRRLGADGAWIR